ncbi:uncharacterized protein LOC119691612 [Plutella xylostella]|uniref:uncharacterized protein LOC119691612 n=1 Tax=Plutella xylostella TaxID=51655 RepID=UPI0020327CF1|nr:uncharacterized protein LOC119691612 [Plutella xylostella]
MLKIVLLVVCVALPLGAPKEHRHRLREYKRSLDVDKALKEKIKRDAAELMREKEEQFEAERDYWMEKYRHRQPHAPAPAPPPPARAPPACPAGTTSINGICVKINGL